MMKNYKKLLLAYVVVLGFAIPVFAMEENKNDGGPSEESAQANAQPIELTIHMGGYAKTITLPAGTDLVQYCKEYEEKLGRMLYDLERAEAEAQNLPWSPEKQLTLTGCLVQRPTAD